jgi:hypothetical protein
MFASGKHAIAICDRCGFTTKLTELRQEIIANAPTGMRVCGTCWEPDHPQLELGKYPLYDPQAIRNARPDAAMTTSRDTQWGWYPVGGARDGGLTPNALEAQAYVGTVTVTTS